MTDRHPSPDQLSLLALARSAGAGAPALHTHLQTCSHCGRLAERFHQVVHALSATSPAMTLPRRLRQRVMAQVRSTWRAHLP